MLMIMIPRKNEIWKNILVMIGFGIISIILGTIRFYIPDLDGGGTDMREIGVLLSVIFLPSWIYMLGVAFIASLNFPLVNLEASTILMHSTASLFAWFYYSSIRKKTENIYALGGLWALMVIVYYTIFLIPTLVFVFYLFKVIDWSAIMGLYQNVLYQYRFELFASTSITTLFIVLYKTTLILKVKNKELQQALKKSEESDRLKAAFINNINHEIRTPLNGIIGFTNLITAPNITDDERMNYSRIIHSSSDQLISTMSNIIELSKIKAGQVDLNIVRFSTKELIDSIYIQYLPLAHEKNLLFEIKTTEPNTEDIIFTDRKIVKQILESLINNALKFTSKGSVSIKYKTKGNSTIFFVEDTGIGIAKNLHENIFNYFSKHENEEDKFYDGIGLGLAIAKALVELLNGQIEIKSDAGKGSVFSFTVPTKPLLV